MKQNEHHPILTITGSDGTGGSGVQADIRTITSLGGYAVSVVTSVTMQNTLGIQEFYDLPSEVIARQIEAIMDDVVPAAVKVGMLRNVETVKVVTRLLEKYHPQYVVYDPVVTTIRGEQLMSHEVVEAIAEHLVPLCHVITRRGADEVVVTAAGQSFPLPQLTHANSHGLGGALSSAIATYLAQGYDYEEAIRRANGYVNRQVAYIHNLRGRSSELYNDFLNQLTIHHATNRDVHFYADVLNVSARYLAQVTKRITGQSPKIIIDEYLLQEIKLSLGNSKKSIQEVAYQYGFRSQAQFTKFFKKLTKESPTQFRNSIGRGHEGTK